MPDRKQQNLPSGLSLETDDPMEQSLWDELEEIGEREPSEQLRRGFYKELSERNRPSPWKAWLDALRHPAVPAFATLLVGLAIGTQLGGNGDRQDQMDALRAEVSALNTAVALSLMEQDSAGERLQGINTAAELGGGDPRMAQALLSLVANDRSQSVRSAAVSALGSHMEDLSVAQEVERLVRETHSPLVQLSLVDLLMRWGDRNQQRRLIQAAEARELLPEVNEYVLSRIERNQA